MSATKHKGLGSAKDVVQHPDSFSVRPHVLTIHVDSNLIMVLWGSWHWKAYLLWFWYICRTSKTKFVCGWAMILVWTNPGIWGRLEFGMLEASDLAWILYMVSLFLTLQTYIGMSISLLWLPNVHRNKFTSWFICRAWALVISPYIFMWGVLLCVSKGVMCSSWTMKLRGLRFIY